MWSVWGGRAAPPCVVTIRPAGGRLGWSWCRHPGSSPPTSTARCSTPTTGSPLGQPRSSTGWSRPASSSCWSPGRPPRWIPPVVARAARRPARGLRQRRRALRRRRRPGALVADARRRRPSSSWPRPPPRSLPGCGLAVERVGASADDSSVAQFVAEPAYVHAWPNAGPRVASSGPSCSTEPAIKMLVRGPELSSDAMVAALTPGRRAPRRPHLLPPPRPRGDVAARGDEGHGARRGRA